MSREQWGHGYHKGYSEGYQAGISDLKAQKRIGTKALLELNATNGRTFILDGLRMFRDGLDVSVVDVRPFDNGYDLLLALGMDEFTKRIDNAKYIFWYFKDTVAKGVLGKNDFGGTFPERLDRIGQITELTHSSINEQDSPIEIYEFWGVVAFALYCAVDPQEDDLALYRAYAEELCRKYGNGRITWRELLSRVGLLVMKGSGQNLRFGRCHETSKKCIDCSDHKVTEQLMLSILESQGKMQIGDLHKQMMEQGVTANAIKVAQKKLKDSGYIVLEHPGFGSTKRHLIGISCREM